MADGPILEVADLRVTYDAGATPVHALRGVTLRVDNDKGDAVGVVGESGSGKTTLALATLRLLPATTLVPPEVRRGSSGALAAAVRTRRAIWLQ